MFTFDWQILCSSKGRRSDFHKYTSEERLCEHTVCVRELRAADVKHTRTHTQKKNLCGI